MRTPEPRRGSADEAPSSATTRAERGARPVGARRRWFRRPVLDDLVTLAFVLLAAWFVGVIALLVLS